jgi:hypothetical protein
VHQGAPSLQERFGGLSTILIESIKAMLIDSIPLGAIGNFIFSSLFLMILYFSLPRTTYV